MSKCKIRSYTFTSQEDANTFHEIAKNMEDIVIFGFDNNIVSIVTARIFCIKTLDKDAEYIDPNVKMIFQ